MFAHLHVHTQYSLLESALKIPDLIKTVQEFNMPAVAITDHGNMFGAVDFYFQAKAHNIKPILGTDLYYTTGSRHQKGMPTRGKKIALSAADLETNRNYRLVLLCKNAEGYRNLSEIITRSYTEGYHFKPRADFDLLRRFSGGLVALTAGLKGEVAYHAAFGNQDQSKQSFLRLREIFKDDLYLEIQENGLPLQYTANKYIAELAQEFSVPLVATSDAHYLTKEHGKSHEVLMCIGQGRTLDDSTATRLATDEFYLKDYATLQKEFAWAPEALSNTLLVAEKCQFDFKFKDATGKQIYHLPAYRPTQWAAGGSTEDVCQSNTHQALPQHIPAQIELAKRYQAECYVEGVFSAEGFLRVLSREGLKKRLARILKRRFSGKTEAEIADVVKQYEQRLHEEVEMIIRTGFSGYFLVVADFIAYAKTQNIPVGPGRGSGAGSLVAYSLEITDIDPLEFNLLFERFINPERISMPDFDIDFCQDRRGEVIDYVVRKYGRDNVAQIITFGKLLTRSVIKDVGRVMNMSFAEVAEVTKLVPEELGITLDHALEKEPRLKELTEYDEKIGRLFKTAKALEGLGRNAGVHAAGVVITNRPLVEYCPLFSVKEGEPVVQYDKDFAEKIGLVKFDFLGLKTLTVIDNAVKFIRESVVEVSNTFNIEDIEYSDPAVFALISSGDNDGIFQLESSGMKDLCVRVQPSNLEDITAINALYRPGPLNSGMVDDYIERKHGRTEVRYDLPQLEDILNETYGVIVYQEQVMRVARVLANYSLGEADILRRAMGKKKPEEMAKQRDKFLSGCSANSIAPETANKIFDLLAKFAEYGFNKSHSAAYGVLSYQTAYLKTYYPAQFMAALMATEMHDTEKMAQYIADAKRRGIEVLPPDVNASRKTFSVTPTNQKTGQPFAIRFGLEAIKGVGGVAVDVIIQERTERGPFKSFVDFCKRVSLRKVNKKVLESLIASGGFDSIAEHSRATLFESVGSVCEYATSIQNQKDLGQVSMFDAFEAKGLTLEVNTDHLFKPAPEWTESYKLSQEKALVGFYVSGHPLDKWWPVAKGFVLGDIAHLKQEFERKKQTYKPTKPTFVNGVRDNGPKWEPVLCGLVASIKEITTKKGSKMAFLEIEDAKSKIEGLCFPESYEANKQALETALKSCQPMMFVGQVSLDEESPKIFLRTVDSIEEYQKKRIQKMTIHLEVQSVDTHKLAQLRAALVKYRGKCPTFVEYRGRSDAYAYFSRYELPQELAVQPTKELAFEVNTVFGRDVVQFH